MGFYGQFSPLVQGYSCAESVFWLGKFFDYTLTSETHWMQALNLADFPVEYGILRADKLRLYCCPATLRLKNGDQKQISFEGLEGNLQL